MPKKVWGHSHPPPAPASAAHASINQVKCISINRVKYQSLKSNTFKSINIQTRVTFPASHVIKSYTRSPSPPLCAISFSKFP